MKTKPRIISLKRNIKTDKIEELIIKDIVKKIGRSGYIALPKELIGKYVQIEVIQEK
ncbi:MAG TPA: DUF2080 family transposase-associated protein [Candidatus Lokiarchaeia archaeon]